MAKWGRWLGKIYEEVTLLVWSKDIYDRIGEIVVGNPSINTANQFYRWLARNYVHTALMGIRRQADLDPNAISLIKLLEDMKNNFHLLTRAHYLSLYPSEMRELGNDDFDGLAGVDASEYPKEKIDADLIVLQKIKRLHGEFIDRRIAHLDRKNLLGEISTFKDLGQAIEQLETMVKEYYLLLTGSSVLRLSPIPQHDWETIFREPWIPSR
jgi:hypothetical protein